MRIEGWESLLARHVEQAYRGKFKWGEADCALWSAEWVRICTGADHGLAWRGQYRTATGAAKLMKKRGFDSPEAIADSHLLSCPVALARRGDLVMHPEGALGIVTGRDSVFLMAEGVTTIRTLDCPKAWRVD